MSVKTYSHEALFKLLKLSCKLKLIDVRDIDFGSGGVIKGAVNIPSVDFNMKKAAEIVDECQRKAIEDVVCYCSYGRGRSVQCAMLIEEARAAEYENAKMNVGYLQGGFLKFRSWYYDTEYVIKI